MKAHAVHSFAWTFRIVPVLIMKGWLRPRYVLIAIILILYLIIVDQFGLCMTHFDPFLFFIYCYLLHFESHLLPDSPSRSRNPSSPITQPMTSISLTSRSQLDLSPAEAIAKVCHILIVLLIFLLLFHLIVLKRRITSILCAKRWTVMAPLP